VTGRRTALAGVRLNPLLTGMACALLTAFLVLKMSSVATPAKWDECLYVYDAQRVLDGQMPYRDFFNFTPPGVFLLQAGWYALFGGKASLTLGRLLAAIVALASTLMIRRSLRRAEWGPISAWVWAALYPVGLYAFWAVPSHHWFANLFFLAAFEAYDFKQERVRGPWGWWWIGLMGGGALFFLQTTAVEMAAFWGTLWALQRGRRLPAIASAAGGSALVVLPTLLWLWAAEALGAAARDVVLWPLLQYGRPGGPNAVGLLEDWPERVGSLWEHAQGIPHWRWALQAMSGSVAYVGILTLALVLLASLGRTLAGAFRRGTMGGGLMGPACVLTAVDAAQFLKGKTDWLHLVYFLGPLGLAWLSVAASRNRMWPAWWRQALAILAGVTLTASLLFHGGWLLAGGFSSSEILDVDRPVREAPANVWLRAQPWLLPGDTVAAFPEGGQVYLYTRRAAVGYTLLMPLDEHLDSLEDHAVVASEIQKNRPRCIVLTADRETGFLDPASPVGVTIGREYHRLVRVEDAVVYLRNMP
jgi:hypothetical protein